MASNTSKELELIKAAGRIAGRALTEAEENRILRNYQRGTGTELQRGLDSLRELFGWSEEDLRQYRASASNNDRIITDIENILRTK